MRMMSCLCCVCETYKSVPAYDTGMDQRTFNRKVTELAEKLKQKGVATSDAMANQLATDIIRTEQSTKEDSLPQAQQEAPQQESSSPKNLVVEEAIKNAQGAAHSANIDSDVDQDKSIAQLLEEDASQKQQQPKVTLDNPVVEGGVARKEKEKESSFIQATPRGQSQNTPASSSTPTPANQQDSKQQPLQEQATKEKKTEDAVASNQVENSSKEKKAENTPTSQEGSKENKREFKPEEKVDLSEMFNFSKK